MERKTTWDLLKKTVDAEEYAEFAKIELEDLKAKQIFFTGRKDATGKPIMRDGHGNIVSNKIQMQENMKVRKAAAKLLNKEDLEKFMRIRSVEQFNRSIRPAESIIDHGLGKENPAVRDKIEVPQLTPKIRDYIKTEESLNNTVLEPFEGRSVDAAEIGKNINKDRKGLDTIIYFNKQDHAASLGKEKKLTPTEDFKKPEFGSPETWDMKVDDYVKEYHSDQKNFEKKEPAADGAKGLPYILGISK